MIMMLDAIAICPSTGRSRMVEASVHYVNGEKRSQLSSQRKQKRIALRYASNWGRVDFWLIFDLIVLLFLPGDAFTNLNSLNHATAWSTIASTTEALAGISIRECKHAELPQCADLIMISFYNSTIQNPWRHMYRMAEINRLQQGFPFGDHGASHKMLVATSKQDQHESDGRLLQSTILGFVDVDARIPNRQTSYTYNPRPYLSDLCVHPDFRRQGIARALIQACEDFSLQRPGSSPQELYIRVEATNAAALQMYHKLGYRSIPNPDDPQGRKIIILHKVLLECREK